MVFLQICGRVILRFNRFSCELLVNAFHRGAQQSQVI